MHFVTSTIAGFVEVFTEDEVCNVSVDALDYYQSRGDFVLLAWVLMPNHFHLILKRGTDKSISDIIGNLKRFTSRRIRATLERLEMHSTLEKLRLAAGREPAMGTAVRKPRFDCLVITSEDALRQKIHYIHYNPIRKRLTNTPVDWRYSSASNYAGKRSSVLSVDVDWKSIGYDVFPSGKDS